VRDLLCIALCALLLGATPGQVIRPKFMPKTFQPVVKAHAQEYAGTYVGVDTTSIVDVQVGAGDKLAVSLHEGAKDWALRDPSLKGAVLAGTAVARDGKSKKFEAVFGQRDLNGRHAFGLLVSQTSGGANDILVNRLFYQLKATPKP